MIAIIFPGQGSQHPGMGEDLYRQHQSVRDIFDIVKQTLGINITDICFHSDVETLRQTQYAQIALYTCGIAAWSVLSKELKGFKPQMMAGHSVGEYTALVAADKLSIEDGAKLVYKRADLMARSGNLRTGTMAAVLGLKLELVQELCNQASKEGDIVVANHNCPGQFVVSGDTAAVHLLTELAKSQGATRVLPLNVSGAFHSPLMEDPAESMGEALSKFTFSDLKPEIKVYSNVTSKIITSVAQWPDLLKQQLKSSVLWMEIVQNMIQDGVNTFIECGCGEVLCGLLKRINKNTTRLYVDDQISLEKTLTQLNEVCK